MSDVDPTPETPVTLGDRMGWWRGDMAARLTTLEQQVAALAGTPAGSLATLDSKLTGVRGDLANLRGDLSDLRGMSNRNLGELLSEAQFVSAQIQLNSKLLDIRNDLDVIKAALGAEPYNDLEVGSVRGYLASILTVMSAQTSGLPPVTSANDQQNAGTELVSGRVYALWSESPGAGITVAANSYDLTGNWAGWYAYIQTIDPSPKIGTASDAPNLWLPLVGTGTINFSVAAQYPIRVFLRAPANEAVLTLASQLVTHISPTTTNSPRHKIVWPLPFNAVSTYGSFVYSHNIIALGNFRNWQIINRGTTNILVWRYTSPTSWANTTLVPNAITTITSNTSAIDIDNYNARTVPFSVEIYQP